MKPTNLHTQTNIAKKKEIHEFLNVTRRFWAHFQGLWAQMCPNKSNFKIWKINPSSFAQALGIHKKESYQKTHVFHSKFQSAHKTLFVFNSTAVEKMRLLFHEVTEQLFLGKFYYLIQIFHVIHALLIAFHKSSFKETCYCCDIKQI